MAQLYTKVKLYLDRSFNALDEIRLQDDGEGAYIAYWSDAVEKPKPTEEQLNALEAQATTIDEEEKIKQKRSNEYPSWQDQMDMQYWDNVNGTTVWKDAVAKVKSDNPKE